MEPSTTSSNEASSVPMMAHTTEETSVPRESSIPVESSPVYQSTSPIYSPEPWTVPGHSSISITPDLFEEKPTVIPHHSPTPAPSAQASITQIEDISEDEEKEL